MRSLLSPLTVLVRPRATFGRLAERPRWVWLAAMVVLLLTLMVNLAVSMPHILRMQDDVLRDANVGVSFNAEESEDGAGGRIRTPEDARAADGEGETDEEVVIPEGAQDTVRTLTVVSSYVFGSLGVVIGTLVLAGVIYGVIRMWSKETAFVVVLGVVALAKMPDALRNGVQAVYTAATGNWVQHQGLGALVAPASALEAPTVPYALLSMIDIYAIWFVVLLFLGLRIALGLERRKAVILTGSFIALGVLFTVVPTLLAGAFMPGA